MIAEVTHGIRVSVSTRFAKDNSNPDLQYFLFIYRIRIENKSEHVVQLLRRHWYIFDSRADVREVEGDGVIGKNPVLAPGDSFEYESACDLSSDIGSMHGSYLMIRKEDSTKFQIKIPRFELIVPDRLN
jgi:ApaG protein